MRLLSNSGPKINVYNSKHEYIAIYLFACTTHTYYEFFLRKEKIAARRIKRVVNHTCRDLQYFYGIEYFANAKSLSHDSLLCFNKCQRAET